MLDFYKEQIVGYFHGLEFKEESHEYSLNGNKLAISVSGVIKRFVEKTDFFSIAKSIDKKSELPKGSTKRRWKLNSEVACAQGDKAHYFGELYAFHRNIEPTDKLEEAIVAFWNSLPDNIVPAFVELTMYHKECLFGGMADIILYNTKTEKFIIADYKTNKDLFKNHRGKLLKPPFNMYLDNSFNKYQIQFSLYQILFEQTGFEVEDRVLVHIKRDGSFELFSTEDLTKELRHYLRTDYNKVGKTKHIILT
jgi:hypothetical protein